jgi:hypothetical protein
MLEGRRPPMVPRPSAIGLTLCDYVIVEEGTKKSSLIRAFTGLRAQGFPWTPRPFCVFATLTDGLGEGVIELTLTRLETDEEVYTIRRSLRFPDRFMEVRAFFRLAECTFPASGAYVFSLLIDGEWVAHRRLRVYSREGSP